MNIIKSIREKLLVPIHPTGFPFIILCIILTFVFSLIWVHFFFPFLILTLWCIYFFRNPVRITPHGDENVVSPADGKIIFVGEDKPPLELQLPKNKYIRISIFMNVFDVHVNRSPMSGKILKKFYFPGKFLSADLDKASLENERLGIVMKSFIGKTIGFVQIAGLVARRIVCSVKENDTLKIGEEFGIIRFGSRVDVWLPVPVDIKIIQNQISICGETILATFKKK